KKSKKILLLSLLPIAGSIPLLASNCSTKLSDNDIAQIFAESSQVKEGFPETWYNAYSTSVAYKKISENMNNSSFIKQVNSNARAKIINVYAKLNESQKNHTKESWIDVYYDLQYKDIVASNFLKKTDKIDNKSYAYHFKTKAFLKDEEANVTKFNELRKDVFANVELKKEVFSSYDPQKFVDELAKTIDKNGEKIVEKVGDYYAVKLLDLYKKTLNKNNLANIYLQDSAKKIIEPKTASETNNDYEILASRTHIKWKTSGNDSVSFQFYIDAGDKQIPWNPLTLAGFKTVSNKIHDGSESIQNGINYLELYDADFIINDNVSSGQIPSIFNNTLKTNSNAVYNKNELESFKKSGSSSHKIEKTLENSANVNVSLKKEKETSVDLTYVEKESTGIEVKLLNSWPDDNAPTITIDYVLILYKEVEANGKKEKIEIARVPKTKQVLDPNSKLITKAQRLNDLATTITNKLSSNEDYEFNKQFINFQLTDAINHHDRNRWFVNNNKKQESNTLASLFMLRQAIQRNVDFDINNINSNSLADENVNKNFDWFSSQFMSNWTTNSKVIDVISKDNNISKDDKELLNELLVGYKIINIEPADNEGKIYANVNLTFITNSSINVDFKIPIDLIQFKNDKNDNNDKNNYFNLNNNESIAFKKEIEFDYDENTSVKLDKMGDLIPFYKLWTNDGIDGIDEKNKKKIDTLISEWETQNKIDWVSSNLKGFSDLKNVDSNNSIYEKIKYANKYNNTDHSLNSTDNNDWLLLRKLGRVNFDITKFSKSSNNSLDLSIDLKYNDQVIKRDSKDSSSVKFIFKTMSNKTKMIREIANKVNNEVNEIKELIKKHKNDLYGQNYFYYNNYVVNIKNIQSEINRLIHLDNLSAVSEINDLFFGKDPTNGIVNRLNSIIMSFLKPNNKDYPGDNIYAKYINGIIESQFKNQELLNKSISFGNDKEISFIKLFENNLKNNWDETKIEYFQFGNVTVKNKKLSLNTHISTDWDDLANDTNFATNLDNILKDQISIKPVTNKLDSFFKTYKLDTINDYIYLYQLHPSYMSFVKNIADGLDGKLNGIDNDAYKELYKKLINNSSIKLNPISETSGLFNIFNTTLWMALIDLFPNIKSKHSKRDFGEIRNTATLRSIDAIKSFLNNEKDKDKLLYKPSDGENGFFKSYSAKLHELLKMFAFLLYTENFAEVLENGNEIKILWEEAREIFKKLADLKPDNYKINGLSYYEYFANPSDKEKYTLTLSYQIDEFNKKFNNLLVKNTDNNIFKTSEWTTNSEPNINNILEFYKNIVSKFDNDQNSQFLNKNYMFKAFETKNNFELIDHAIINEKLVLNPSNIYSNTLKINNVISELEEISKNLINIKNHMNNYVTEYVKANMPPFKISPDVLLKISNTLKWYNDNITNVENWSDLLHNIILKELNNKKYKDAINALNGFNQSIHDFYDKQENSVFHYEAKDNSFKFPIFRFKEFKNLIQTGGEQKLTLDRSDGIISLVYTTNENNKIKVLDLINVTKDEYTNLSNANIELKIVRHKKSVVINLFINETHTAYTRLYYDSVFYSWLFS
uniref:hypothetical protein n=1 Tax=Mycoplasmopsis primatum TaxID=55604 RepID=UPI00056D00DB